jgi:hypothetical protein
MNFMNLQGTNEALGVFIIIVVVVVVVVVDFVCSGFVLLCTIVANVSGMWKLQW